MNAPKPVEWVPYPDPCASLSNELLRDRCEARRQQQLEQWTEYLRSSAAIRQPYKLLAFAVGSAVVGVLWFIVFWAVSWVLAGFARDERPV